MKIRTVAQLKSYLKTKELSPERFADQVNISNMTIRRLLKKSPTTKLPSKYYPALDSSTDESSLKEWQNIENDFSPLLKQLEQDGQSFENANQLKIDLEEKVKDVNVGEALKEKVKYLWDIAFGKNVPVRQRALSIGALLYFVNPLDLIPDATPIFGYVDDFAIMTLAITCIVAMRKNAAQELEE